MFPVRPPSDQERFLGYLPHSGFHNQRMSLESAIQLAAILNRTLLLPPLYLSEKALNVPWSPLPELLKKWTNMTKTGHEPCRDYDTSAHPNLTPEQLEDILKHPEKQKYQDKQCEYYLSWTTVPWTLFYNIPKTLAGVVDVAAINQTSPIQVFDRPNMTIPWLTEHLEMTEKDIYWVRDKARYDYRILDDSEYNYHEGPEPLERYERTILLSELQARKEKVVHFGSLYGPGRVEPRSESHIALAKFIPGGLEIWNQAVLDTTKLVESQIRTWIEVTGRSDSGFLSAHLRTLDGMFMKTIDNNLRLIVEWIREKVEQDTQYKDNPEIQSEQTNTTKSSQEDKQMTFLDHCMGQPPDSPLIFLATDVNHPRSSPVLQDFFKEFPCTMILSDFSESWKQLDSVYNPLDNAHMLPYMLSLVDANIAAKGRSFQGTEYSTFSMYISDNLWPQYHQVSNTSPAST
ncbi:hypothetical protein BGZ46_006114 [Entomortierella lignicola]|nr:hypothetical protein BGZ46_006114 [Entomortierella lignicola]